MSIIAPPNRIPNNAKGIDAKNKTCNKIFFVVRFMALDSSCMKFLLDTEIRPLLFPILLIKQQGPTVSAINRIYILTFAATVQAYLRLAYFPLLFRK